MKILPTLTMELNVPRTNSDDDNQLLVDTLGEMRDQIARYTADELASRIPDERIRLGFELKVRWS